MKKEQLGQLIIASEETLYHVAKTLLYSDADCADAIQETIVKAFTNLHPPLALLFLRRHLDANAISQPGNCRCAA